MLRLTIGAVVGGLVQFIIGAIAWASPLGKLAFKSADITATAEMQQAMARALTPTGTGTYFIPAPDTAEGTAMLGTGPVGLVHFNTAGFPVMDPAALIAGLVMSIVMMLLIGVALSQIDSFAGRVRALVLIAVATTLYFILSLPVYNIYMPWAWWSYLAVECFIAFVVGGFVMLKWFMPAVAVTPRAAPETALPPESRSDAPPVI